MFIICSLQFRFPAIEFAASDSEFTSAGLQHMRTFQATIRVWLGIPSELRAPPQKPLKGVCCCLCMAREAEGERERDKQPQKRELFSKASRKKKAKRGTNFLCEISENMKRHKYVKMHGEIAEDTHTLTDKQTHTHSHAHSHTLAQRLKDEGTYLYKRA